MDDPLRSLLLDAAGADRAALAALLSERVGIDAGSGRIVLLPGYSSLSARHKVLLVLLAAKAAHLLEVRDGEAMGTQELVSTSGLPRGTVSPKLKELRDSRLVAQGAGRAYYVPNAVLHRVADEIAREA